MPKKNEDTAQAIANATPSKRLAGQIADLVCKQGLIPLSKRDAFEEKLAEGKMLAEDWLTFIEMGLPKASVAGGSDAKAN